MKKFTFGPFVDYQKNPILVPPKNFKGIYNPAVIKENKSFYMLIRMEPESGNTGIIGFAKSNDGFNFTVYPEPVLIPSSDFDRFGCEDPRVAKIDNTYFLIYVGNSRKYNVSNICLATSKDLLHWQKHGQILSPKLGNWDQGQLKSGVILPNKINGKYIMYFMGEEKPWKTAIGIAYSEDLFNWYEPQNKPIAEPRENYFDSYGIEPGPNPILIDEGILLIYNGWGKDCVYKPGFILCDIDDPTKIIARSDEPIALPSQHYGEKKDIRNHMVAESLIKDKNKLLLYYGAADRVTCLSILEEK